MPNFRAIKMKARRDLHLAMRVPVYVFLKPRTVPKLVHARLHREETALGNVKGTSFAYSERREQEPKVIFEVEEHRGERKQIVVADSSEAYKLDNDEPTYNITKTWHASALTEDERSLYRGPGECVYGEFSGDLPFCDMDATAVSPTAATVDGDFPTQDIDIEAV